MKITAKKLLMEKNDIIKKEILNNGVGIELTKKYDNLYKLQDEREKINKFLDNNTFKDIEELVIDESNLHNLFFRDSIEYDDKTNTLKGLTVMGNRSVELTGPDLKDITILNNPSDRVYYQPTSIEHEESQLTIENILRNASKYKLIVHGLADSYSFSLFFNFLDPRATKIKMAIIKEQSLGNKIYTGIYQIKNNVK